MDVLLALSNNAKHIKRWRIERNIVFVPAFPVLALRTDNDVRGYVVQCSNFVQYVNVLMTTQAFYRSSLVCTSIAFVSLVPDNFETSSAWRQRHHNLTIPSLKSRIIVNGTLIHPVL